MFTFVTIKTLKNILAFLKRPFKWLMMICGVLFLIIFILSFTTLPFWMYHGLGTSSEKLDQKPEYIIIMSGGGIPSASGLMRTYLAAKVAEEFPEAKIIVTMPGDTLDSLSSACLMKNELLIRGIEANRIMHENIGTNTRSQALEVKKIIKKDVPILIVTSPEHIYRSVKTFKKVGFSNVGGDAAFSKPVEASFEFDDEKLGGNQVVPNIGENYQLRYQFWNHLQFQIIVYREYVAITFYKLKGWI
ncbi:MAG: YdcF family protein [Flavobacteriales bacterium]|nr:YdcF family protein [Flavobacteriales bacterium]